jgi:hypothetical protein
LIDRTEQYLQIVGITKVAAANDSHFTRNLQSSLQCCLDRSYSGHVVVAKYCVRRPPQREQSLHAAESYVVPTLFQPLSQYKISLVYLSTCPLQGAKIARGPITRWARLKATNVGDPLPV